MDEFFKSWQKVCLYLTRRCNFRCRGCNVINYQSAYELTTEEWKQAFEILKEYEVGFVVLFGGEPTLRDDLPNLIKHLNNLSLPHTIITNSYRLLHDNSYYNKLLSAHPFGISCSVNTLSPNKKYDDDKKSNLGIKLIDKLLKDGYDGDLVANVAVTHQNIEELPSIAEHFTSKGVWCIFTFFHACNPHHSMYWWYRGPITPDNANLIIQPSDKDRLHKVADYFLTNYDNLLLHNSRNYFEAWKTPLPYKQNWKCSRFTCPQINPDGSIMVCVDRPLTKPITIFDLKSESKIKELKASFEATVQHCPGCFWDHMYDTNLFALEGKAEEGKKFFAHQHR